MSAIHIVSLLLATTLGAQAGLFDGWNHRATLTFGGYPGAQTLTNFPVLVDITNFTGFAYAQVLDPAGGDLRFSDATGNVELNYEIDTWNPSGASHVWVQVPALSGSATRIWAYWGNATATAPSYASNGATWSNGYVSVWHFAETSGTLLNDSAGTYDGTAVNGVDFTAAGKTGSGARFDGADDAIQFTGMTRIASKSQITVSGWVNLDSLGPSTKNDAYDSALFSTSSSGTGATPILFWFNQTQGTDGDRVYSFNVGDTSTANNRVSTGKNVAQALVWQHVAGVMNGTSRRLYVNGTDRGSTTGSASSTGPTTSGQLGTWTGSVNMAFDGAMDEVRLSSAARSADWIQAEWLTAASNTVFTTYGSVIARTFRMHISVR